MMVALVLAQVNTATAFVSDLKRGPYVAQVNITGTPTATLTVALKLVATNAAATEIGWTGVTLASGWAKADQYLEVTYVANQVGWGVQMYTNNKALTAVPQYPGDPTTDPNQQPNGLIGVGNSYATCPIAVLVTDVLVTTPATNVQLPVEVAHGIPGKPSYGFHFTSGYNADPDPLTGVEFVWNWLKDKKGTKWVDDGDDLLETGELVDSFSATGDDVATIVNTFGSASGWIEPLSGKMLRFNTAASPIFVYVAAKFTNAKELQVYKTNTLELEIYHT